MQKTDAFFKMTYGLYLITCTDGEVHNAYIANTAFQVSSQPARFAISCHKENFSSPLIQKGKSFGISVLQQDTPLEFIQKYGYQSAHKIQKFNQLNYKRGITGVPLVYDYSVAWFECRMTEQVDVGTHWLFIGEVVDFGMLSSLDIPLDYSWYRQQYKAVSPSKAPTYVPEEGVSAMVPGAEKMKLYACGVCEYVYNPARGDASAAIAPGTPFDDLPHDWVCPVCGVGKVVFTETGAERY